MKRYNPKDIEPKWQQKWADAKAFAASDTTDKPKKYILEYFPYPSGAAMHVGHVRNYAIGDTLARHARMRGYNVLHPMGWDAFGLPAENYAIKTGISPQQAIADNTSKFKRQLTQMGFGYDWDREVNSSDPDYYRWTQWFFLLLFKRGLAYRKESLQWWCPVDKTVLANEQVEAGLCWRCGSQVEKKALPQWFFKITDYADRLAADLDDVNWSDALKNMQRNWIGRSEGIIFKNAVRDTDLTIESFSAHFEAFTANTFAVIAPDHPFLPTLVEGLDNGKEILAAAKEMALKRDVEGPKGLEKVEGIFTGRYAVDLFGDEDLPIWIANYALADYGTGIVLCSAHDERDFEFAKKYGIRLKPTMVPTDPEEAEKVKALEHCFTDMKNGVLIEPAAFAGKVAGGNRQEIIRYLEHEKLATSKVSYKIRDWLISRQRYWGAPIPIIHCPEHGPVAVPEDQLPVILPEMQSFEPSGDGRSPLARVPEFVNTTCPTCGGPAERETDTMDGFACSSWYFLRYADPHNTQAAFSDEKAKYWMPVDDYIGGAEHAVMHLLYVRFWFKVMQDEGLINFSEPIQTLRNHGMILAPDGSKMSKSKGNTIEPDGLIDQGYGADAIRIMELFIGPWNQAANWSVEGMGGAYRFLQRVWALNHDYLNRGEDQEPVDDIELKRIMHRAVKRVSRDLEQMGFNTAIAALMETVNELYKAKTTITFEQAPATWAWTLQSLLQLLAPFAPHITDELWEAHGKEGFVGASEWPVHDEQYVFSDVMTIVVQVNGKVRSQIEMPSNATQEQVLQAVDTDEKVAAFLDGKPVKKRIYVPGKLVNLVV